uniref:restriction endonuclease subunit S n=1 Tax=Halothiobacillus sp. TaxID=1891311 RepID=UPI002613978E
YKPYPAYKDSGVEWIGRVPEHWGVKAFKRLASIRNGQDYKDVADPGGAYPVIGSGGEFARASSFMFDGESVLLGRKGTIDKPLYINGPFWTVDTMFYTTIANDAFPRFVYYSALTIPFGLYSTNTALPSMTGEDISSHVIAAPEFVEQKAIARVLDRETSRIDALITKKTRFIELLKEKIVALASQPADSPNLKWVRLSHVCEVISRPVLQKAGSSYTKLGLFNRGRGIFKRDETDTEDMGDSEFFWVQPGDLVISGQFAWEGAVALANENHAGCVVSHRFPVIRGRKNGVLTEYLLAYFWTIHGDFVLNDCSRGSAGRNRPLNMNLLLGWKIPVPSMQIQREVARLVQLERQIGERVNKSIALLRERRSTFITAAVTGQIDLRDEA